MATTQSKPGTRLISSVKIDDYVPPVGQLLCMRCHVAIENSSTAHHGRIHSGWQTTEIRSVVVSILNGQVVKTPTIEERSFPRKITGYACDNCFDELWHTTWLNKAGHTIRAFENIAVPVEQPKGDDHEAAGILKGLYAPHAHGGKGMYDSSGYSTLPTIDESRFAAGLVKDKLQGFNRPERDDINLAKPRIVVKAGKFKVSPDEVAAILKTPTTPLK